MTKRWAVRIIMNRTYLRVVEAESRQEAIVKAVDGDTVTPGEWTAWTEERPTVKIEAQE